MTTDDYGGAVEHYGTAQDIFVEIGDRPGEAEALMGIGHAEYEQGRLDEAREQCEDALRIIEEFDTELAASVRGLLA